VIKRNRIAVGNRHEDTQRLFSMDGYFAYGVDLSFCYHWSLTLKIV
jgi:hypothetical protein